MKNEDAQLVNQFLTGDENAFTTLLKKYQKSVHALTWRKVGDFHIAEELTQDAFLKAYQKLATLKNPNQFAGWLYVIADRICIDWHRKQKPSMESLETTSGEEIEESSYRHYEDEQREAASVEHRQEHVRSLLEKLPESERTVVTLHYLGEMTYKAISEFLGVSPNTVKSRLQRARNRLKAQEDLVSETLGSVDLPMAFTENIVKQIANIKPAPPTNSKPLIPWAISAATAIFIFLIIGVGSQYLAHFQKPYNLNARSETTVEIIDVPVVLDTQAKLDLRNQAGRFDTTGKSKGAGPQVSEPVMLAVAQVEQETLPSTKQQWIQANGPEGGTVSGLLLSSTRDIYTASPSGIYRLAPNVSEWTLVSPLPPETSTAHNCKPMAERNGTLYLVSTDEVWASTDSDENWKSLGTRPKGTPVGLAITDHGLYLALENQLFRSENGGKQWTPTNDGIVNENTHILTLIAIENTVFVGMNHGLYRSRAGVWEKLPVDTTKAIHSLAVSKNNLYVGTGPDLSQLNTPEGVGAYIGQVMSSDNPSSWEIFHSTDLGDTWTELTPKSTSFTMKISPGVKVLAAGETLLALGVTTFRSTDGGKTWTDFGFDTSDLNALMNAMAFSMFPTLTMDENTFFKVGIRDGLIRSTDGGQSWHPFTKGMVGTKVFDLVAFKNALYANTGFGIAKSADNGKSWKTLSVNSAELALEPPDITPPTDLLISAKLAISDGVLYGISAAFDAQNEVRLFRLSASGDVLVPIQGPATFGESLFVMDIIGMADATRQLERFSAEFAVSGETFYMEYKRRIFRWKRGELEWFNTGLIDKTPFPDNYDDAVKENQKNIALAVSKETVYVGKRDGHLFQSFDSGNTWKDLTSNLPLRFKHFKEIVFAGPTVYVATDAGVLTSETGEYWRAITDKTGMHTIIDRIAVSGTTVYGAGNEGAYQLNRRSEWKQISPEVPDSVLSLVINGNKLYAVTEKRGMFQVSLEAENY
ncbi:sigma-70 family RNA polymerase sigma factor [Candidatus Poribacteria bacterium]|nr:sigma-70 family RNA polymerase sigma factor [Candidatus Poribacteria bacterium]